MSYAAPIIHYTFDTDGTNSGSLGSSLNITTIPSDIQFDSANKLIGDKCISIFSSASLNISADSNRLIIPTWTTPNSFTISQWMKIENYVGGGQSVMEWIVDGDVFALVFWTSKTTFLVYHQNTGVATITIPDVFDNQYHHFLFTVTSASVVTAYIDNVSSGQVQLVNLTNKSVTKTYIGSRTNSDPCTTGYIDDFKVYGYVADATMRTTMYKLGSNTDIASLSGESLSNLQNLGASISQLVTAGFIGQLLDSGVTVAQLLAGGATVSQLLAEGVTQIQIDIALTQIKIHNAFTISDGTNTSAFATDAVYTPTTFADKLTDDLTGNTVTVGSDVTLTGDGTDFYRIYLQFANAATLTDMPKYIFNIPFSDFSVGAGGQVNLRNVHLDAQMTMVASYIEHHPFELFEQRTDMVDYIATNTDGSIVATSYTQQLVPEGASYGVAGSISVFQRDNTASSGWTQIGGQLNGVTTDFTIHAIDANYGGSLNLSEDGQIVSASAVRNSTSGTNYQPHHPSSGLHGYIRVWKRDSTATLGWVPYGNDIVGYTHQDRGFNHFLSGDGTTLIVNPASGTTPLNGFVEVFKYSTPGVTGGTWNIQGDRFLNTEGRLICSGISYDGTIIAMSNPTFATNNGRVQIFVRDLSETSGWLQVGHDIVGTSAEKFGTSTKLSKTGDLFASVSSEYLSGIDTKSRISVYKRDTTVTLGWSSMGTIVNPDTRTMPTANTEEYYRFIFSSIIMDGVGHTIVSANSNYSNPYPWTPVGRVWAYTYDINETIWKPIITNFQYVDGNNTYLSGGTDPIIGTYANESLGGALSLSPDGLVMIAKSSTSDQTSISHPTGQLINVYTIPHYIVSSPVSVVLPANNYFINDFVSTIETDLINFTLSYDASNALITFEGLAQDISMSITSTDTTIFDTTITEITVAANTLPFITYGQPDPTFANYITNGMTITELLTVYTITELLTGGVTITELLTGGVTFTQLLDGGLGLGDFYAAVSAYTLINLVDGDVTFTRLLTEGATVEELLATDPAYTFSIAALLAAGITFTELLDGGVSIATLLASAGITITELLAANVSAAQLLAANVSAAQLLASGITFTELLAANVSAAQLLASDITITDLLAAGITFTELLAAGIVIDWNLDTNANHFDQTYVKGFVDVSGSIVIRNDNKLITNGELSLGGNLTINPTPPLVTNYILTSADLIAKGFTTNTTHTGGIVYGIIPSENYMNLGAWLKPDGSPIGACELTGVSINSLDDIEPTRSNVIQLNAAWNGATFDPDVGQGDYDPARICKYPTSNFDLINPNTTTQQYSTDGLGYWLLGRAYAGYCYAVLIRFTLNGTTPSVEWIRKHNSNAINPDTGDCRWTSSDARLIEFFNTSWPNHLWHPTSNYYALFDLEYNTTVVQPQGTTSFTESMTLKSRLFMGEDISANGNVYVGGDLSVNGQFSGNFANGIIPPSAIISGGGGGGGAIYISGNVLFAGDVSFNGPTVDVSNTLPVNQIEFNDATYLSTYDDNILSGTFADSNVIFKDSTFAAVICEGTATATTVTQSSDHRIKQNVTELNEMDTVDALVPIQYNNTLSGKHEFGLLAHELQEIYPELVVGEKDGAEYQQVHYNGLIGVLVKEIQDMKQRLAVLNNR